jgi:hypothetical protein
VTPNDKRSSLLWYGNNCGRKIFYLVLDPHLSLLKYFLSSPLAARPNKLECLSGAIIFKQERTELTNVQRIEVVCKTFRSDLSCPTKCDPKPYLSYLKFDHT